MVLIRVAFLGDRRSRHVSLKLYPSRIKPEMITFVFLMVQKTVRSVIGNSHKREYLSRPCKRFNHMLNSKLVNFISPPNHACYKWVCQSACIHDLYFFLFFSVVSLLELGMNLGVSSACDKQRIFLIHKFSGLLGR